jgi:hypothetical protein
MNHPVSYTIKYDVYILKKTTKNLVGSIFVMRLKMLALQRGWKKVTFLCDQIDNDAQSICYMAPETTHTKHHIESSISLKLCSIKKKISFSPYND